jgi:hypothetical protein
LRLLELAVVHLHLGADPREALEQLVEDLVGAFEPAREVVEPAALVEVDSDEARERRIERGSACVEQ